MTKRTLFQTTKTGTVLEILTEFNPFIFELINFFESCYMLLIVISYRFEFKGIIDYIFYSKQTMKPLGLLGPLSTEWITQNKVVGCPHPHIFSDHFPLLVELEMVPTVSTNINGIIGHR